MDADEIRARVCAALGEQRDDWLEEACRRITAWTNQQSARKIYDTTTLGGRLRAARELAGMTQAQLGRRIGLGHLEVSAIERGVRPLPAQKVPGLCLSLKISVPWLLGKSEQGGPKADKGLLRRAERPEHARKRQKWAKVREARLAAAQANRRRAKTLESGLGGDTLGIKLDSTRDTSHEESSEPIERLSQP